jgi:hypothetical protein
MQQKSFPSGPVPNDSSRLSDWPFQRPCTKQELAQEIRSTPRFIEHEVARGNLRSVRLGLRNVRFLPSDVLRWLNARPSAGSEEVVA